MAEHNGGMKVSNLYIAQVKRKCGLELAENFNLPKSEDSRQPQCPKEKEEAIMEVFRYVPTNRQFLDMFPQTEKKVKIGRYVSLYR